MGCGDESPRPHASSTVNGVEPMLGIAQAVLARDRPSQTKVRNTRIKAELNSSRGEQAVGMFLLIQFLQTPEGKPLLLQLLQNQEGK